MKTKQIEISSIDESALKNDLSDIDTWLKNAINGKINSCKKRMVNEWLPQLYADKSVETIPATQKGIITLVVARSDYKDRAARDAE
tara:strand:+ start:2511 stop:2768 length:258 start_codon:yes stop_codon:yes gene_type:complete